MGRRADAGGAVHGHADVVAVDHLGLARVQPHADADVAVVGPVVAGQRQLGVDGAGHGRRRLFEGDEEGVATGAHFPPALATEGGAHELAAGGFLGVDVFFVLSGFLLTTLLLGEHEQTGTIDRVAYAVRRVRRIAPALLVLLAVLVVIVPIAAQADAHRLPGDVVSSLLGLTNWHLIGDGSSYFALAGRPSFVRHLWSIAVEVQFYVLCPFLVAWLARRKPKVAALSLVAGIAASATLMGVLYRWPDPSRAYYGTDTRLHALLIGCLVPVLLPQRPFSEWIAPAFGPSEPKNAVELPALPTRVLLVLRGVQPA